MKTIPYLVGSKQFAQNLHIHNLAAELSSSTAKGHKGTKMTFNAIEVPFKEAKPHAIKSAFYPTQGYQWRDRSQGGLEKTNNPFHLAIQGKGFFVMEDQTYTRDGQIFIDPEGTLINAGGLAFSSVDGDVIQIPPEAISLNFQPDGRILDHKGEQIAQINMVEFENMDMLKNAGHNRYRTDEAPLPPLRSSLMQGYIEHSNVEIAKALVEANSAKVDYQMLGIMIRKHDEMQQQLTRHLLLAQA